ncbi:hypothetical protein MES4922_190153 [Mesorhizobium ventifaucium]|uniref:Uncharacterized protein n=1 Tax=Mesorhizobium ventifaucium TaxID=666020 RepID=A0ABN8JK89_9HYPH|nr:hypothetical protein MES4922_190153 [Mesorhizobium ventifaucium]
MIPSAILFLFCAGNYAINFCMALNRATDPPRRGFLFQVAPFPSSEVRMQRADDTDPLN